MNEAQKGLGISASNSWLYEYYQHANRLAILWFLHQHNVPAHLVLIYFLRDNVKGKTCPISAKGWISALKAQDDYLGLGHGHRLENFIHKVFLPVRF